MATVTHKFHNIINCKDFGRLQYIFAKCFHNAEDLYIKINYVPSFQSENEIVEGKVICVNVDIDYDFKYNLILDEYGHTKQACYNIEIKLRNDEEYFLIDSASDFIEYMEVKYKTDDDEKYKKYID